MDSVGGAAVSGFVSVIFDKDEVSKNLRGGSERVNRAIQTVFARTAPDIESDAKVSAPWTDRTGNARNGLACRAGREGDTHSLTLFGQVPYQLWLEIANSGSYRVIMPTLERWQPKVIDRLNGILGQDIFR